MAAMLLKQLRRKRATKRSESNCKSITNGLLPTKRGQKSPDNIQS